MIASIVLRSRGMLSGRLLSTPAAATTKPMSPSPDEKEKHVMIEMINNKMVVTLNRPKSLNALSLDMISTLIRHIKNPYNEDGSPVDMVLIRSSNEKAFCSGVDILGLTLPEALASVLCAAKVNLLHSHSERSKKYREDPTIAHKLPREMNLYYLDYLVHRLKELKIPHVALMDGITMGGGSGLSIDGQFRVATERTVYAMPETAIGFFPDAGGTYFLSRLKSNLGMFLGLTGQRLQGVDSYHAKLATHFLFQIESIKIDQLTEKLLALPKAECNSHRVDELLHSLQASHLVPSSLELCMPEIKKCFGADSVEEILGYLAAEDTSFAMNQLEVLSKMSPTSLKVAFKQIRLGKSLSFSDVCQLEHRLAYRLFLEHDFHEGVRSVLIDKDRKPKWNPSRLEDVSQAKVDAFFVPLTDHEIPELELND